MSTKNKADGASHAAFSPYDSPFSAFTNYMNVLADFLVRVEEQYPENIDNEELNSLLLTIRNQSQEIEELNKEVKNLRNNILNADDATNAPQMELLEIAEKGDVESPSTAAENAKAPAAPKAEKKTSKKASPKAEKKASGKTAGKAEKKVTKKTEKKAPKAKGEKPAEEA